MIKNLLVITLGIAILIAAEPMQLSVANYIYFKLEPLNPSIASIGTDLIHNFSAIVPGLVVGWLLQRGHIAAGFFCGTFGYLIYYITFELDGINCLTVGIFVYIAGLCTTYSVGNAFASGTAHLLRVSITKNSMSAGVYNDSMLHLNTGVSSRVYFGVAVGVAIYLTLKMGIRELMTVMDDAFLVNGGSYPAWASGIAMLIHDLPAFLCGFASGWVSVNRGILVGFVAGFLGSLLFIIGLVLLTNFKSIQLEFIMPFTFGSLMPAIWGGLAGGAAQLLRANKSVQPNSASDAS